MSKNMIISHLSLFHFVLTAKYRYKHTVWLPSVPVCVVVTLFIVPPSMSFNIASLNYLSPSPLHIDQCIWGQGRWEVHAYFVHTWTCWMVMYGNFAWNPYVYTRLPNGVRVTISLSLSTYIMFQKRRLIFMPPAQKGLPGASSNCIVRPSVCLSLHNSFLLTNKVQYFKFWWWCNNQSWTIS